MIRYLQALPLGLRELLRSPLDSRYAKKLIVKTARSFLPILKIINKVLRNVTQTTHRIQHIIQWGASPTPEWYDHHLDVYYSWSHTRIPYFLERGVFNLPAIKQGSTVLELCCGDGFNAKHFYSNRAKSVISVDFDKSAIDHAKKNNKVSNVDFIVCDIRTEMPAGKYENVIWDAAIEHFTPDEISSIMSNIKGRLTGTGILSGYTLIEKADGIKQLEQHEYEFKSKEDLANFLSPYFNNVKVFETIYPTRHNLYFWASDVTLPFDENWESQLIRTSTR